jgi:mannitol/fructose-specific phosphotransferase system IIA component (Ntr-type)
MAPGWNSGSKALHMKLRELFSAEVVSLELESESKDDILKELVGLLGMDEKSEGILYKTLKRRENLGSTGIGKGIAIPHCRSLVVNRLRLAYGRKTHGVDFRAIDNAPVYNFFLIIAPPLEVSNQYLPVLGKIAQFAKDPDIPNKLRSITEPEEFLALLEDRAT